MCNECKKSKKHARHKKDDIIEISVTDEIKNILNGIINIYKKRIEKLNKEKKEKEKELFNKKEYNKEKKIAQNKNKANHIYSFFMLLVYFHI